MSKGSLRMATRGSALALAQAGKYALDLSAETGLEIELVIVRSTGDAVQDRPLHEIGGKGLFTKELERALLDDEADFAVHSLKDLPYAVPKNFALAAMPQRVDARDVIIGADNPQRIGTGSPRRALQLQALFPQAEFVPIRGNIETRIGLIGERVDAVVLAQAGLLRCEVAHDHAVRVLEIDECLPCSCQGILAVETLVSAEYVQAMVAKTNHRESMIAAYLERAILRAVEADCTLPVAVLAQIENDEWVVRAGIYSQEQSRTVTTVLSTEQVASITAANATEILADCTAELLADGGADILQAHRNHGVVWPQPRA